MPLVLLPPATVPLPVALVPPIALEELAPELGLVLLVLIPDDALGVLLALLLGVLLALLLGVLPALPTAPLVLPGVPAVLLAVMLYFCSSSDTRELNAESCCRTASTSVVLGVVAVELATVDESVVEDVLAVGAPGAGVVVTTRSSRSLQAVTDVHRAMALAASKSLLRCIRFSMWKVRGRKRRAHPEAPYGWSRAIAMPKSAGSLEETNHASTMEKQARWGELGVNSAGRPAEGRRAFPRARR